MDKFDPFQIQWQIPWEGISSDVAARYELELRREICAGHVLFNRPVTAVGQRRDCDDVLFYLGDGTGFVVVHLTCNKESRPEWPATRFFDSFQAWYEQCMITDAIDFSA